MDIVFFKKMLKIYEDRNASDEQLKEFYEIMFRDLSKVKPEELTTDHLEFFKAAELFFASIEEYHKAEILTQMQDAANAIFKARERVELIKKMLEDKNKD